MQYLSEGTVPNQRVNRDERRFAARTGYPQR
jgi:hypothetical protein